MTDEHLLPLPHLTMALDDRSFVVPHRLLDLRACSAMNADHRRVRGLARASRGRALTNTERVALLTDMPMQYACAWMLSDTWRIHVGVFDSAKDTLEWLSHQAHYTQPLSSQNGVH
jgi:hypothetical protein